MSQNENIQELITELEKSSLNIDFRMNVTESELRSKLSDYINSLITKDFSRLIAILYRLDISERNLKELLQEQPQTNAGNIIADMIIERQLQKIETRKKYFSNNNIDADDKW